MWADLLKVTPPPLQSTRDRVTAHDPGRQEHRSCSHLWVRRDPGDPHAALWEGTSLIQMSHFYNDGLAKSYPLIYEKEFAKAN